jgi:hypothetical protein
MTTRIWSRTVCYMVPVILSLILTLSVGFGLVFAAAEAVKIEDLKINDSAVSAKETKVTLYKPLLHGGKVYLTGKASSGQGPITSVEVTTNNKKAWRKAFLSPGGEFQAVFRPKAPAVYMVCLKATDAKGGQNDVDATCREVTISDKTVQMLVREVLDKLIEAYEEKNTGLFMSLISDDFYGDKTILDSSLRSSQNLYHNVDIRYTLDSVVPDYVDKIFAAVTFNRQYTLVKTGKAVADSGSTAYVFKFEGGHLKVLSMARPLMFLQ